MKVVSVLVTFAILVGIRGGCRPAIAGTVEYQRVSSQQSQMAKLDEYLAQDPMFRAIKQVEPQEHRRFRAIMNEAVKAGKTQAEAGALAAKFGHDFMQKRLRHASAATLKQYLKFRVNFIDRIATASADGCYDILMTGSLTIYSLPEEAQQKIRREQAKFSQDVANIIVAPLSDSPIPQNKDLAERHVSQIAKTLTDIQLRALRDEGKPNVDKKAYCQAYLSIYRKALQLPEAMDFITLFV
jgi:hypothetical protein